MPTPEPPSDLALAWLLELFEYQIGDLLAGREPRGGERSVRELRGHLRQSACPSPLRRRLMLADRQYSAWRRSRSQPEPGAVLTVPAPDWPAPATDNPEEAAAWAELRQLAWHADLMAELHAVTQRLRQEPEQPTLRVLYAVTENAERALRRLPTPFPVPGAHDVLVSLGSREVVRQLTRTLGELLLLPGGPGQVWQALDRVEDNPFPPQPGDDALLAQLAAIPQWASSPHERAQLEEALRASAGPQSTLQADPRERPLLREAAQRIRRWLARRLARAPGQLAGTVPTHSVLYAQEAASALNAPAAGDGLTLHLGGPERLAHWQGLRLSWRSLGANWQLLVQDETTQPVTGGQLALLRPDLPASERQLFLTVGGQQLQVLFSGDYVLLRRWADAARTRQLARVAALGRACAVLLLPAEQYGRLRLARALARRLRGDPPRADDSAGRDPSAQPPAELLGAARRSLQRLAPLLERFSPAQVAHEAQVAQTLLQLPPHYAAQVQRAAEHAASAAEPLRDTSSDPLTGQEAGPPVLPATGQFSVFSLGAEPLEVRLPGDRLLTLRPDYRAELVALLPGQAAVTVGELLVLPLHDLSVVVAREGSQVALGALLEAAPD